MRYITIEDRREVAMNIEAPIVPAGVRLP